MPELSDFNVIFGAVEDPISIRGNREFSFNTGGREQSPAVLTFTFDEASIERNVRLGVNGNRVGRLIARGFLARIFLGGGLQDQSVHFRGSYLNDGSNRVTVRVPDGVELRLSGIVCHFHQRA